MRRSSWWLAPAIVLFLGCGDDPAAGSGAGSSSSGAGGGGAAGGGGHGGEAVGERLLVRDPRGAPVAGLDVVVHDATGALVAETTTGTDGAAPLELPEGGGGVSILWVEASTSDPTLRIASFFGLEKGAELRLVVERQPDPPHGGVMHLEFEPAPSLPGGAWNVEVSCYGESNLGEAAISYTGCASSTTFDVLVHYQDGKRQVFAGESFVPGETRTYALEPSLAEPAPPVEVVGAGLPAGADYYSAGIVASRPEGGDNSTGQSTNPQSYDPVHHLRRPWVSEGGKFDLYTSAGTLGEMLITRRLPLDELPESITWTPASLAGVETVGPVTGTQARPEVAWTIGDDGPLGEAVRVSLHYSVPDLDTGAPLTDPVEWSMEAPASATGSAPFPELPPRFATWLPATPWLDWVGVSHRTAAGGALGAMNAEYDRKEISDKARGLSQPTIGQ